MKAILNMSIFTIVIPCCAFALEYDASYPPAVFPSQIIKEKINEAFQFVGRDLLIPDKVELDKLVYEIVQENEKERFESIAIFEMDGFFEPQKAKPGQLKQLDAELIYKQSMWIRGLEIASRDYRVSRNEVIRADGFRVDFQEDDSGRIKSAVILYQNKRDPAQEIIEGLGGIKSEIQKLQENVSGLFSEINKSVSGIKEKSDLLAIRIAAAEKANQDNVKELQEIIGAVRALEAKVNSLSNKE